MTGHDRQYLQELVKKGESENIEFKESLGELRQIIETVVAFANKNGGKILVGVRDDGSIVGVKIGKGRLENLANNIVNSIEPPIYPSILTIDIDDKTIILIDVPSGTNKPYFYRGKAFIRIGKTNKTLSPSELKNFFQF